jgi:hypothetical protein
LLDEITRLSYENLLPRQINGNLCNTLIRQFQTYKGINYIPPSIPNQLKWTLKDPMDLLPIISDSPWQVINTKINNKSQTVTQLKIEKKRLPP